MQNAMSVEPSAPSFSDLGTTAYTEILELQRSRMADVISGNEKEIIFLTEHLPVYTLGKHGNSSNLLYLPEGVECVRIERGGDITYHAPGQLVVYPIVSLWRRHLGVKEYVYNLEQWVIDILSAYNIKGERADGAPGVWLDTGTLRERKICALGVKVRRGVTMHGFALNANIDLSGFRNINPCGFQDKGVTSIAQELGHEINMAQLVKIVEKTVPPAIARDRGSKED